MFLGKLTGQKAPGFGIRATLQRRLNFGFILLNLHLGIGRIFLRLLDLVGNARFNLILRTI